MGMKCVASETQQGSPEAVICSGGTTCKTLSIIFEGMPHYGPDHQTAKNCMALLSL